MEWFVKLFKTELIRISGTPITPVTVFFFLGTIIVAALLGRLVRQMIRRFFVRRDGAANEGLAYALGRIAQYLIFVVGFLMALENLGISLATLAAFGAVLTVGIGFGLQNIAQNFISGLILLIERPVQKGDVVVVSDNLGTVEEIAMRATRIVTRDGVTIIVPNSEFITAKVVNRSAPTPICRVKVEVGVAYGSDTDRVRQTLLELARSHDKVLAEPAPVVLLRSFGASALEFEMLLWLPEPLLELSVTSDLRFAIDAKFRELGIEIPFPQQVVHEARVPRSAPSVP
jgi:small-conductance mechanosensitive channel